MTPAESEALVEVQRMVLEKVRIAVTRHISGIDLMEIESHARLLEYAADSIALAFAAWCAAGAKHEEWMDPENVPSSWWQHLRQGWCPRWWLRRHPVRERPISRRLSIQHVCPHIALCGRDPHVDFLRSVPRRSG